MAFSRHLTPLPPFHFPRSQQDGLNVYTKPRFLGGTSCSFILFSSCTLRLIKYVPTILCVCVILNAEVALYFFIFFVFLYFFFSSHSRPANVKSYLGPLGNLDICSPISNAVDVVMWIGDWGLGMVWYMVYGVEWGPATSPLAGECPFWPPASWKSGTKANGDLDDGHLNAIWYWKPWIEWLDAMEDFDCSFRLPPKKRWISRALKCVKSKKAHINVADRRIH